MVLTLSDSEIMQMKAALMDRDIVIFPGREFHNDMGCPLAVKGREFRLFSACR